MKKYKLQQTVKYEAIIYTYNWEWTMIDGSEESLYGDKYF